MLRFSNGICPSGPISIGENKDLSSPNVVSERLSAIFENRKIKACDVPLARDKIEKRICQDHRPITCGLVFEYVLTEYAMVLDRPRWGLKTPYNEFFAEDIIAAHPNTRMIQLIRDPRDVAVSFRSYDGGLAILRERSHCQLEKFREDFSSEHGTF